jgi:hypothetical protein
VTAAIVDQGKTSIRNSLKTLVTHVAVSTDSTAFGATQTAINPSGAGTNLIKASTDTDVSGTTFDSTITIDGTTEFTGLVINTIGLMKGATRTDVISRSVRSVGIGVQAGDSFTIGVRVAVADNS